MNLAALDRIALKAAATHWNRSLSYEDRADAAWSAAAEALCTATTVPSDGDLLRAARDGITRLADSTRRFYGLSQASGYVQISGGFASYWWQPPLSGWEDAVTDRIALEQVWVALSHAHRQVLAALAFSDGNQQAAAALLGADRAAYRTRLARARLAFRSLWNEGEPTHHWGRDRKADSGRDGRRRPTVTQQMAWKRRRLAREAARAA